MKLTAWVVGLLFLCFFVVMMVLEHKGVREDAEEERRRIHKMLNEMPRKQADLWLRNHSRGRRCACGMYNLKYTDTVKADTADHQPARCQPALERIEIKENDHE